MDKDYMQEIDAALERKPGILDGRYCGGLAVVSLGEAIGREMAWRSKVWHAEDVIGGLKAENARLKWELATAKDALAKLRGAKQ